MRYTLAKPDRINNPRNGQHPERDQNEIGTRYEFAYFEAIKGQDRVAPQYTLGFLVGAPDLLKNLKTRYTPEKRDRHEFR